MEKLENIRHLIDLALVYGRKQKSPQTGFIHYHCASPETESHHTIPMAENFLYALTLFRTRLIENITEGKALLERLLHFQNKDMYSIAYGNFPIYLHEYPICKDRFTGLEVAASLFWILKMFHQVLGHELKTKLEQALSILIAHAIKTDKEKKAPYTTHLKIAALSLCSGKILNEATLENYGFNLLKEIEKDITTEDNIFWYNPESMGNILTALVMVYPKISDSPWHLFWKTLENTWYPKCGCYIGPSIKDWQKNNEPEVTVYDLFLGYLSDAFSSRALKSSPVHLQAALIPPIQDDFKVITTPYYFKGNFQKVSWVIFQSEHFAYSALDQKNLEIQSVFFKGFHPLRIVFGDAKCVHTFVIQGSLSEIISFEPCTTSLNTFLLKFELPENVDIEDKEKSREVSLYFDRQESTEFLVDSEKASTFLLEDFLSLKIGLLTLNIRFKLLEGVGQFFGHRMLGNRPSQIEAKGESRFEAFDWILYLRTIGRSNKCVIGAKITLLPEGYP